MISRIHNSNSSGRGGALVNGGGAPLATPATQPPSDVNDPMMCGPIAQATEVCPRAVAGSDKPVKVGPSNSPDQDAAASAVRHEDTGAANASRCRHNGTVFPPEKPKRFAEDEQ